MEMYRKITVILCKLKIIFPTSFWNVIEHLLVHLAQEAHLGGLVHYRWMDPFERFFSLVEIEDKE